MEYKERKPENAIILAAGVGKRMIPININIPKGLVIVKDEPLIERLIKQLNEKNIRNIYIVTGHLREKYSYLEDKFNVTLINNLKYADSGNIVSLFKAKNYIDNSYIIHSNLWLRKNPFKEKESSSFYMVEDKLQKESSIKVECAESGEVFTETSEYGNKTLGISFIAKEDSKRLIENMKYIINSDDETTHYWESALSIDGKFFVKPKVVKPGLVYDLNSFEDLRMLDNESDSLDSKELTIIATELGCKEQDIKNIKVLKKGMTNRSFKFRCNEKKYIMRIPGEGTSELVDREAEYNVYKEIKHLNLTDRVIYIDPKIGYKITEYLPSNRNCDPNNISDVKRCMEKLKGLHNAKLKVDHEFNLFERMEYYENLRQGAKSIYKDYDRTKEKMYILKRFIDSLPKEYILTHIDAVPENFLIHDNEVTLIDWEYSSMADPHIDLAMFSIYSGYDKDEVDKLLNIYFEGALDDMDRIKIYAYMAVSGLLWSNWCEYKSLFGVEFGDYGDIQYGYAKNFFNLVEDELKKLGLDLFPIEEKDINKDDIKKAKS